MYHTTHTFQASEVVASSGRPQLVYIENHLHEPLLYRSPAETRRVQEYCGRYVCMGLWLLYLLGGYLWTRAWVPYGLPSDASQKTDWYSIASDLFKLTQFGVVLGWFTQVMQPTRFAWMFSWERWYAHVVFLAASPIYSAVSNIPAFQHSLVDIDKWGREMWMLVIVGAAVAITLVLVHVVLAVKSKRWEEIIVYVLSRAIILGVMIGAAIALKHSSHSRLHLHHYFIFWFLALFAEFSHPASAITLLLAASLFVQGVAAYSFAPIWEDPHCLATHPSSRLTCVFQLDQPFQVRLCPLEGSPAPFVHCFDGESAGEPFWSESRQFTRVLPGLYDGGSSPGGSHAASAAAASGADASVFDGIVSYERILATPEAHDFAALVAGGKFQWAVSTRDGDEPLL